MTPRKGYTDGPLGQIHWRAWGNSTQMPDLYCLHPAPLSGLAFKTIAPLLAEKRRVIAPDYPGHGGSHPHSETPDISDYASAVCSVIKDLSPDQPVDLLGFHTGCLVAAEMQAAAHSLILIDVPAFDPETRAKFLPASSAPFELTGNLASLEKPWQQSMVKRIGTEGHSAAFDTFIDHVSHGRAMNAAFYAAFTYDVETAFSLVEAPTTILATKSMLLEPSRRAATLIPAATFIERLDISGSVLDQNASTTVKVIEAVSC